MHSALQTPNFAQINLLPEFRDCPLELKSTQLYKFSLPFRAALNFKHTTLHEREGLILILTDSQGRQGISEISPLPGFSRETLDTAILNTTMILEKMMRSGEFVAHCNPPLEDGWGNIADPSVASYGVESAIISLLANVHDVSVGTLMFGPCSSKIPINGLIRSSLSEWVPEAEQLIERGFKTLKIKVGRINHILEARGILEVRRSIGDEIQIRLDGNRNWDLNTSIEFGHAIEPAHIEYIEEPLVQAVELPRFFDACGVPFALDETLHHVMDPMISFEAYTGLKALVLKPTLIACTARLIALVKQARGKGLQPVISSSYESDVGLNHLAQLAGSISGEHIAVGLDTRTAFTAGTTTPPVDIQEGWLSTRPLNFQELDFRHCELLHEI